LYITFTFYFLDPSITHKDDHFEKQTALKLKCKLKQSSNFGNQPLFTSFAHRTFNIKEKNRIKIG